MILEMKIIVQMHQIMMVFDKNVMIFENFLNLFHDDLVKMLIQYLNE
jgi:hypothetical protein